MEERLDYDLVFDIIFHGIETRMSKKVTRFQFGTMMIYDAWLYRYYIDQ